MVGICSFLYSKYDGWCCSEFGSVEMVSYVMRYPRSINDGLESVTMTFEWHFDDYVLICWVWRCPLWVFGLRGYGQSCFVVGNGLRSVCILNSLTCQFAITTPISAYWGYPIAVHMQPLNWIGYAGWLNENRVTRLWRQHLEVPALITSYTVIIGALSMSLLVDDISKKLWPVCLELRKRSILRI